MLRHSRFGLNCEPERSDTRNFADFAPLPCVAASEAEGAVAPDGDDFVGPVVEVGGGDGAG